MKKVLSLLSELKNVIFPDICPGCQKNVLVPGRLICTECLIELPFTDHFDIKTNKAASHFYGRMKVHSSASLLYFKEGSFVQDVLHSFKYRSNKKVGLVLGNITGEKMLLSPHFRHIDVLLPVPLHPDKEYIRGYNQSRVFGDGISEKTKLPMYVDVLLKSQKNPSQTGKNRIERVQNVADSYSLKNPVRIKGKHILLVDDVITTGATLEACGLKLLQAEPASISIVTIACAV